MNPLKKILSHKSIWKGMLTFALFILVFSVSAPAYSTAAKRVDQTTQDEIAGQADGDDDTFDLNITSNLGSTRLESTLQILIMLTILALAPSILIMLTSFTRIIVVFFENSSWYTDHAAKSGTGGTGSFYDDCHYDAGFYSGL